MRALVPLHLFLVVACNAAPIARRDSTPIVRRDSTILEGSDPFSPSVSGTSPDGATFKPGQSEFSRGELLTAGTQEQAATGRGVQPNAQITPQLARSQPDFGTVDQHLTPLRPGGVVNPAPNPAFTTRVDEIPSDVQNTRVTSNVALGPNADRLQPGSDVHPLLPGRPSSRGGGPSMEKAVAQALDQRANGGARRVLSMASRIAHGKSPLR